MDDIVTPLGVIRGGLPAPTHADAALVSDGPSGVVTVFAVATTAPTSGKSRRDLDVVAAFEMDETMFVGTFQGVIDAIEARRE